MISRSEALTRGTETLRAGGIENPARDAALLLAITLGVSRGQMLVQRDAPVAWAAYARLLERRAAREPMALIRGEREFFSLPFAVSPDTLIPRSDSETLVHAGLAACPDPDGAYRVLDLGTGTGCLLLSFMTERRAAFGLGIDRVFAAAALAARNARALGLADRAQFVCADWAGPLAARFDLVLCNPPYIRRSDIDALMPEVSRWEPASALCGGEDGLAAYRAILPALDGLLRPSGSAVLEVGHGQAAAVADLGTAAGFATSTRDDLGGVARVVVLVRKKPVGRTGRGD